MIPERIRAQCAEMPNGCWEWIGYRMPNGYAKVWWQGRKVFAHRLLFVLERGPIPDGLTVDHLCHNTDPTCQGGDGCLHRGCVNPAHLEAVTHGENVLRGKSPFADHARKTHCIRGHPFFGSNLVIHQGHRECRECNRARLRASRRRRKAIA